MHFDRHPCNHSEPITFKTHDFFRIIGKKFDLADAEVPDNLRTNAIIPEIGLETKREVRLYCVLAFVLKFVSLELAFQADSAPFLPHIENHAFACFIYHLHGVMKLLAAVAAHRTEY